MSVVLRQQCCKNLRLLCLLHGCPQIVLCDPLLSCLNIHIDIHNFALAYVSINFAAREQHNFFICNGVYILYELSQDYTSTLHYGTDPVPLLHHEVSVDLSFQITDSAHRHSRDLVASRHRLPGGL